MAGDPTTSEAGCLIVLDSKGNVIKTISGHHINGPWDMTALDGGPLAALFVTMFGLIAVREGVYFVDDASNTFNFLH